jgi:hypothetical protein
MQLKDASPLPPQAQQAIRKRAVIAVIEKKRSQGEVAQEFGVTPTAVNQWVQQEGGEIHWGDEMGLGSDHQAGTCWSEVGKTPIVEGTGQRFSCNLISTLTNRRTLRFQVFQGDLIAIFFWSFYAD